MEHKDTPFKAHLFVCCNDRNGEKPSCADHNTSEVANQLKNKAKELGLKEKGLRVSKSKCLGPCGQGAVAMIYPQQKMLCKITEQDVDSILEEVQKYL